MKILGIFLAIMLGVFILAGIHVIHFMDKSLIKYNIYLVYCGVYGWITGTQVRIFYE